MKPKQRTYQLFFLCLTLFNAAYSQAAKRDSIRITYFHTKILNKDSVWNTNRPINIPTQPSLLEISLEDSSDSLDYQFICVLKEIVIGGADTIHLKKNKSIHFTNLSGGDYSLQFINLHNNNKSSLKFRVEAEFWQKWWFVPFLFLIIVLALSLIFYFVYLIQIRSKLNLQAIKHDLEIKALRAQMNPHFIFNSMNTIDAYILRKRFVEASDCLQKFSKLVRLTLENSENQTISISQDLETLRFYAELEQERFSNSFDFEIKIDPELLEKNYQIPPLLIQPFVENAILHGIRHLTDRRGSILVELSRQQDTLLCVIQDNGIGRAVSREINKDRRNSHKSMGMNITLERISLYQSIYGNKMRTLIKDLPVGTSVEVRLPLIAI